MSFHKRLKANYTDTLNSSILDLYFNHYSNFCVELHELSKSEEYIILKKHHRHLYKILDIILIQEPKIISSNAWLDNNDILEVRTNYQGNVYKTINFKNTWIIIPKDVIL